MQEPMPESMTPEEIHIELNKPFISQKAIYDVFGSLFGMTPYYCRKIFGVMRSSFDEFRKKNNLGDPGYRIVPKKFFDDYLKNSLGYEISDIEKMATVLQEKDGRNKQNGKLSNRVTR